MNNVQKYYLPEPTPWPIFGCSALLMMAVGAAAWVNRAAAGLWLVSVGVVLNRDGSRRIDPGDRARRILRRGLRGPLRAAQPVVKRGEQVSESEHAQRHQAELGKEPSITSDDAHRFDHHSTTGGVENVWCGAGEGTVHSRPLAPSHTCAVARSPLRMHLITL